MLINLKALSEAKIFKKKKNSGARETSQTSAWEIDPFISLSCGIFLGILIYNLIGSRVLHLLGAL